MPVFERYHGEGSTCSEKVRITPADHRAGRHGVKRTMPPE